MRAANPAVSLGNPRLGFWIKREINLAIIKTANNAAQKPICSSEEGVEKIVSENFVGLFRTERAKGVKQTTGTNPSVSSQKKQKYDYEIAISDGNFPTEQRRNSHEQRNDDRVPRRTEVGAQNTNKFRMLKFGKCLYKHNSYYTSTKPKTQRVAKKNIPQPRKL